MDEDDDIGEGKGLTYLVVAAVIMLIVYMVAVRPKQDDLEQAFPITKDPPAQCAPCVCRCE